MSVVEVSSGSSSSTATPNRTLQGPTKAGHAIFVSITSYLGAGSTLTHNSVQDDQGGGTSDYTKLQDQVTTGASDNYRHTVWIRENLTGASGTTTVTVNCSASGSHNMCVLHLDRVPASGVVDTSTATTGSSTAPSVTLSTTGTAKCLIVSSLTHNNGSPSITPNATNLPIGYLLNQDNSATEAHAVYGRRVAATGAYTTNWTLGASSTWSVIAVAIKQEGGPNEVGYEGHNTPSFSALNGVALTPSIPIGLLQDDILVLYGARKDNTAGTTPTSSGATWAAITGLAGNSGSLLRFEAYWCRVPSGGVASVSFTFGSSTIVRGARVVAFSGCPTSGNPWDTGTGAPTLSLNTTADTTIEFTDVTTTVSGALALAIYAYGDDPTTATVMTNYGQPSVAHQASASGTDVAFGYEFRQLAAGAAAGVGTVTISGGTFSNSPSVGALLALVPAVSGSTGAAVARAIATLAISSAAARTGITTGKAEARLTSTALSARAGAATGRAEARVTSIGASARSAAAVERATGWLTSVAGQVFARSGAALFHAEGRLTVAALKAGLTSANPRGIGRLTVSASKSSIGAATERGEGRLGGSGTTARAAQALLRAVARLQSASAQVPATTGAVTLRAVARILAGAGIKGSIGSGADRAEGRLTSANVTARVAVAALRASARAIATSGAVPPALAQAVVFRASGRILAAGARASAASATVWANGRTAAVGAKLGAGTATLRGAAVGATVARRGGVGAGSYRAAGVLVALYVSARQGIGTLRARAFGTSPRGVVPTVQGGRATVLSGAGHAGVLTGAGRGRVLVGAGKAKVI